MRPIQIITLTLLASVFAFVLVRNSGWWDSPEEKQYHSRIKRFYDERDGSMPVVVDYVKSRLSNPASYEHVLTVYTPMDSVIEVRSEFTYQTEENVRITANCFAILDTTDGKIISAEILDAK